MMAGRQNGCIPYWLLLVDDSSVRAYDSRLNHVKLVHGSRRQYIFN